MTETIPAVLTASVQDPDGDGPTGRPTPGVLKVAGENVSLPEVEAVLAERASVFEAAVATASRRSAGQ
jgi:acyl-CoA synthetase (AMP-forming)/AMP-acid ligase II